MKTGQTGEKDGGGDTGQEENDFDVLLGWDTVRQLEEPLADTTGGSYSPVIRNRILTTE